MTEPDEVMQRVGEGIAAGRKGERELAGTILQEIWNAIGGSGGDPFHRCAVAHSLADVQDHIGDELAWDLRALQAADALTDDRVHVAGVEATARSFFPSLHLNLADDYLRLGETDKALEHIRLGADTLPELGDDGYAVMIRDGLARIEHEVDSALGARPDRASGLSAK